MYYINFIFLYSFLGFVLESVYFKVHNSNNHSGIFLGPYTFVYGFGILASYLFFKLIQLPNNIFSYIIDYFIFVIITSLIECAGGHIIHYLLHIDKWDYRNYKYHLGKYLCLNNSLIWGILVFIIIFYIHPYLDKNILLTIPKHFTIIVFIFFTIDLLILIINNKLKTKK